ncbi:MAG: serine hydrolase, partial [Flavobacteriales bacterium]|nr:serine hydrolase [Flavobacteriales bacterium]
VDGNTQFAVASNSKAFTAASLAIMVDEGKLKWDDPVRKYLPDFTLYDPYVSESMTVRDLLCHRSGLATFSGDLIWYGTDKSREEVVANARYLKPTMGFRAGYGYSNIMFLAAGEVLEKVSGTSWDRFVLERFFRPLNMPHTNTSVTGLDLKGNVAMPHNEVEGKNVAIEYVNWDNIGPAGSINSSANDMSQWLRLQLKHGNWRGKQIWAEARTWEMWENQTPKPVGAWQRENMPSRHWNGYGLGWDLMEFGGYKIVSHGGGYDGMISKTMMVPELGLGVVILTNNINNVPTALSFEILEEFMGMSDNRDWLTMFLGWKTEDEKETAEKMKKEEEARHRNTSPSLPLTDYCGTYRSEMYGDVVVR